MEVLVGKYEELKTKVEQYFDDNNLQSRSKVPVVSVPPKPTKEEWLQHQATHTPYAPWCKHCVAARAVRHAHPSKGRRAAVVGDVENSDDPRAKVSIDYMYLHERAGQGRADASETKKMSEMSDNVTQALQEAIDKGDVIVKGRFAYDQWDSWAAKSKAGSANAPPQKQKMLPIGIEDNGHSLVGSRAAFQFIDKGPNPTWGTLP